jgi:hypothetical protein
MAEHEDQNTFSQRELAGPLARAQEIEAEHSLWVRDRTDSGGHERFSWQRARDLAWNSAQDAIPGWNLYRNWHRYRRVLAALRLAGDKARQLIVAETGTTVEAILAGLLPSLLDLAKWVGLGAVIGGAIGALGGPADEITVPGGALAGAEVGLWVANSLGLASLLVGIAKNLRQFVNYAKDATEIAWYAGEDHRNAEQSDLVAASKLYAQALAELWLALLQALVAEVLKRVGEYMAKRIASPEALRLSLDEITKKIGSSKLGPRTAEWFRQNFEQIRKVLEERRRTRERESGGDIEDQAETTSQNKTNRPFAKPQSSSQQVQSWASQFPTKQTPNNGDPRNTYEIRQTGPVNTEVRGGNEKIWADGIDIPDGQLQDAKYIADPAKSPYVDGSKVPDFIRESIRDDFEDEVRRYGAVINDPNTPVTGLQIITNEPQAVPYFQSALQKYSVPGSVVVKP